MHHRLLLPQLHLPLLKRTFSTLLPRSTFKTSQFLISFLSQLILGHHLHRSAQRQDTPFLCSELFSKQIKSTQLTQPLHLSLAQVHFPPFLLHETLCGLRFLDPILRPLPRLLYQ